MTHSAPTRITCEGGGFMASCACGWLRYETDEQHAAKYRREHEKTCKGPKVKAEPDAPKPRAKTDWSGREAATWIDKL